MVSCTKNKSYKEVEVDSSLMYSYSLARRLCILDDKLCIDFYFNNGPPIYNWIKCRKKTHHRRSIYSIGFWKVYEDTFVRKF